MMTDKEIDILKYSLGLDRSKTPYRNYFAIDIDGSEYQGIVDGLVSIGLMYLGHTSRYLKYYGLTDKGRKALADSTGLETKEQDI